MENKSQQTSVEAQQMRTSGKRVVLLQMKIAQKVR